MLQNRLSRLLKSRPFLFFSIVMLFKSMLTWFVIFDDGPSWTILITELPFAWLIFGLIEMFASKRKLIYYVIADAVLTGILFAVFMYHKYYGVIATWQALQQVNQVTAVSNSVFSLMDPYYTLIFLDIIVITYLLIRRRKELFKPVRIQRPERSRRNMAFAGVVVLSFSLSLFNILPNRASMNEHTKAEDMGILNYEAYALLDAGIEEDLLDPEEVTQERIDELKGIQQPSAPAYFGSAKGKNVIIVQMESFQNFLIGLEMDGREVTPNLNKLARESLYFDNFYQMVGQGNTSDAEFVVNTSFYVPEKGAAAKTYFYKNVPSLAKLLKQQGGYESATFHTNVVDFWNRRELYKAVGFDTFYDQEYFGKENTVYFGSDDEVLYAKTLDKLKEMDAGANPFYAQLISMTAHHPFTLTPETAEFKKLPLPEKYEDNSVGDYLRAQNYADYAFGQFVEGLKKEGLWEDTLLVVYGDHQGMPLYSLDAKEKELMQEISGREYDYSEMTNVPLIMSLPGVTESRTVSTLGGQVDVLPTVANLTGATLDDQIHFGQDLLNSGDDNIIPQRYYLPSGSFLNGSSLFIPGVGYEDGTRYSLHKDQPANGSSEDEYNRALELLRLSDSYMTALPEHGGALPEEQAAK
ncbi:Phosphoglycerol transferase MdoB [Paenibacillaceae bacterium GAS479]|nr:Phosphoglycerol transferase MdoB [Paenibacillaceae bacterium GAS479]